LIVAIDWRRVRRASCRFAVSSVIDGARVPIVANRGAKCVARSTEIAVSKMGREGILANRDRVEVVRVARREVADFNLGCRRSRCERSDA